MGGAEHFQFSGNFFVQCLCMISRCGWNPLSENSYRYHLKIKIFSFQNLYFLGLEWFPLARWTIKTQLFSCRYGFRPQVPEENGHRKWNFLKKLSRVELFENAVFVWTGKNGIFRKRWRFIIGTSLPARKKMAGNGDFTILLCIKRL